MTLCLWYYWTRRDDFATPRWSVVTITLLCGSPVHTNGHSHVYTHARCLTTIIPTLSEGLLKP
jgi:hypothetical protein